MGLKQKREDLSQGKEREEEEEEGEIVSERESCTAVDSGAFVYVWQKEPLLVVFLPPPTALPSSLNEFVLA